MIIYKKGDLLEDPAEALVNAVNTVGVMEAGIAKQFKLKFPKMYIQYKKDCEKGLVTLGKMHVYQRHHRKSPKYIINFPTLGHWREEAKLENIEKGLEDLMRVVEELNISSIAIPPLGCGVGGLAWEEVKELFEQTFEEVSFDVHLYEPL